MTAISLRLEAYAGPAKQAISDAQALADERQHAEVEPLHLLYKLVERPGPARAAVERTGLDPTDVLVEAEVQLRKLRRIPGAVAYLSPRLLDVLARAEGEAARERGVPVSMNHLLLSCAQDPSGPVGTVLRACGLSAPVLRNALTRSSPGATPTASAAGDSGPELAGAPARPAPAAAPAPRDASASALHEFGTDLTAAAERGELDPVVGRDAELRRILQVLARRRENNPLLVGEPGIGRTSIVHALASRIARGDVPGFLTGKRIVSLELATLTAGARLRGQLEERIRSVLDAVRDAGGEVLLFLPGLSAVVGDRNATGAAELISGALSRGEVRAIAVATTDEARRILEGDSPLGRRFVPIQIEPPTIDDTIAMLRGLVSRFEMAHGVRIGDPALIAATQLARRYVQGVNLPKSAVDLIDEAAALVRLQLESAPAELDALMRRVELLETQRASLEDDHDADSVRHRARLDEELTALRPRLAELRARWQAEVATLQEVRRLRAELSAAEQEYERAKAADHSERAAELRQSALPLVRKQLAEVEADLATREPRTIHDAVGPEDVARVIETWTGVPVARMLEGEAEKLLRMEARLQERVIGQDEAVAAVCRAVRRGRVGLRDPRRPIGSFLFLGPTGVGKTELAKALAEFLFDDEASLTRLDMSEFMEKHMVARLLGSPPGYVDSEEGGFLTEAVRRRPYSVVLFDEMEKAHPDVFNILLQVLDDGRLTDSRGRLAHFADTVVIMTSNVGGHAILDHEGTPEELREVVQQELQGQFRPEFLNRIDDVVIFNQLTKANLCGIADIQLRALGRLLAMKNVQLEITDGAKARLVDLGHEPAFGARPLKRVILKRLQDPLAEALLRDTSAAASTVRVDVDGDGFTFASRPGHE